MTAAVHYLWIASRFLNRISFYDIDFLFNFRQLFLHDSSYVYCGNATDILQDTIEIKTPPVYWMGTRPSWDDHWSPVLSIFILADVDLSRYYLDSSQRLFFSHLTAFFHAQLIRARFVFFLFIESNK